MHEEGRLLFWIDTGFQVNEVSHQIAERSIDYTRDLAEPAMKNRSFDELDKSPIAMSV